MNINSQKQSSSDDIPIPSAPSGRVLRVHKVRALLSQFVSKQHIGKKTIAIVLFLSLCTPSFLFSPVPVIAVSKEIQKEPVATAIPSPETKNWNSTLSTILQNEISRHHIDNPNWIKDVETYIAMVKHIESDGNRNAYNQSGAMSYFQFKAASIKTAYTRLINYMVRYNLGRTPIWSKHLSNDPESIYSTSEQKQALFMIINIIEQDHERGTDYFAQFLAGDQRAGVTAYYKYHHTNPDQATKKRTERLFRQYFKNTQ